jgi:hypothetical protein
MSKYENIKTAAELIRENVPATKEQEREAVGKIRAIITSLGGIDSYVGMAMQGVLEIAECNIENDFGDSMYQRFDSMRDKYQKAENERIKAEYERDGTSEALTRITAERNEFEKNYHDCYALYQEYEKRTAKAEETVDALANKIIALKAKLYDLTCSAAQ